MSAWWWLPIDIVAWCGLSLMVGLWLGPALRRSSRAREALDAHVRETLARREEPPKDGLPLKDGLPPEDGPRAA